MSLSRRSFLHHTAPLALVPMLPRGCEEPGSATFAHGVASGDPLRDRVVLWTRVTPSDDAPDRMKVFWTIAEDVGLTEVVQHGVSFTDESHDFTVKVDARGLRPGRTYYYAFQALGVDSPIGRTRTLPARGVERLRLAVASCSNYPFGFFNAYRLIAERADLDVVLHLGDYLYEYENGGFGDGTALGRVPEPNREIVTLSDYRQRHAQYKTDPDLQQAHRQHPFIAVWDDHESADDSWLGGATNHQPLEEGEWELRKAAAIRAYHEWMPIREEQHGDPGTIYRSFEFGDLLDLIMLDTRLAGRDQQVADPCDSASIADPNRQLLGAEQEQWLEAELRASKARETTWRVLGQQVMFGQLINLLVPGACIFNVDQWDGYAASRQRVLQLLQSAGIDNVVILTGDIHSSWGNDITANPFDPASYDPATGSGSVAVEIVTPGVTSPGIDDPAQAAAFGGLVLATHPHVKYVELNRRGYALLDVTRERVQAEWYHVATIAEPLAAEALAATFETRSGTNHLVPAATPSLPRSDAPALAPEAAAVA